MQFILFDPFKRRALRGYYACPLQDLSCNQVTMPKTPRKIRPSIKREKVSAFDYQNYNHRFSCDDCSHFDANLEKCTLGYPTEPHRKAQQAHEYMMSGTLAFCRSHEID